MVYRLSKLSDSHSFFLFGARGTGKSTLLRERFSGPDTLWIDLLTDADEERFGRNPDALSQVVTSRSVRRVVIDEVQKSPKLLDVVHHLMEGAGRSIQFILTGSSARKLKRGAANLLAGRAFTYQLFPLTARELGDAFQLQRALELGTLPKTLAYQSPEDCQEYLRSYVRNYLREEIQIEQLVRHLDPFRSFLEVAAQTNGKVLNCANIARDVGADDKTIRNYFSILEDTLLGFHLPAFHRSVRKQQRVAPKFYFIDPGMVRAAAGTLRVPLLPQTSAFGDAFEHWVILECHRANEYQRLDYRFSYLATKDNAEIDLIIQRPGEADLLIEIKSSMTVLPHHVTTLRRMSADWDRPCVAEVWSQDPQEKMIDGIRCRCWRDGLQAYFS